MAVVPSVASPLASIGGFLQRLFSTFANGWPGRGLLLQRLLTATVLFHCAISHTGAPASLTSVILQIIGVVCGILLLLGLWTPFAGTCVAITELGLAVSYPGDPWMHVIAATLGATLAMIGPGAWSIDARLFGRKKIEIPGR